MLKSHREEIYLFVRIFDLLLGILAFGLAGYIRFAPVGPISHGNVEVFQSFAWLLSSTLVLHFLIYPHCGFYAPLRLKKIEEIVLMILRAAVLEFFVLGSIVFLIQAKETSRYFFGLYVALNFFFLLMSRLVAKIVLSKVRQRGYNFRHILVLGGGRTAHQVLGSLNKNRQWGYLPFGVLADPDPSYPRTQVLGVPIIGTLADFEKTLETTTVDEVIVALDQFDRTQIESKIKLCETLGVPVRFTWGRFSLGHSRSIYSELEGVPMVSFYNTTLKTLPETVLKRLIDIAGALAGLGMTAVLYPWIAYRIKKESPGPVIFKQVRVGQNGRRFKCYKFRTMEVNADSKKNKLQSQNVMVGPMFKMNDDPRVFPFGGFLRRTSLDELPQFMNILRGDMSLVGTRPPTPDEVETYLPHYKRRLSIRPGLTGLWQVKGRSKVTDFKDVLDYDLRYIDHWSLLLDLRIIFRTVFVIFHRKGAC